MGNRRKLCQGLLALTLALFASGCWDRVEIEERGFVIGVAFDLPKSVTIENREQKEAPNKPKGPLRYVLTQQFVVPARLKQSGGSGKSGGGQGGGGGGGGQSAFANVSSEGDTVFGIIREVATRTSRTPYFEHIQNIIVSDQLAKTGQLANLLDLFVRDNEVRRGTKVFVSVGEARRVLSIQPETETLPAMYINSVFNNSRKNARILPLESARLGDIHEHFLKAQSFVVPQIGGKGREVKLAGAAVIDGKTHKMVGFLGEEETEGLNFLTGKIQGGVLEIPADSNISVFEIKKVKHEVKADVSNMNHIIFTIHLDVYGKIGESFANLDFMQAGMMKKMEESTKQQVMRFEEKAIQKVQHDFQKDVLDLGNDLRVHHYKTWKAIHANWDQGQNYFAKSEIRLTVDVNIDNSGGVNRSEKQSAD